MFSVWILKKISDQMKNCLLKVYHETYISYNQNKQFQPMKSFSSAKKREKQT